MAIKTIDRRTFVGGAICATALLGGNSPGLAQPKGSIKIGAFGPMSGNAAAQGQSIREAVEMVVNVKNANGGVLGKQIEVVIGDDAGKPEEAAVVARRFATRDQVVLAIGSVSSPASLAAAQVFREEELPTNRCQRHGAEDHHARQRMGVPLGGAGPQAGVRHGRVHQREDARLEAVRLSLRER